MAAAYPDPRSELDFKDDYQLVVAVILSAQCTDKKVNQVTPQLFGRFADFAALAKAPITELEQIIRPINYYRTKARNLIAMAQRVVDDFNGKLPGEHPELTSLPGIGRKTANVVVCEKGCAPALPVDTHVFRVSKRLGLADGTTVEKVEDQLKLQFAPQEWRNLHHWLIFHGRRVCKAQRPQCGQCVVNDICPGRLHQ